MMKFVATVLVVLGYGSVIFSHAKENQRSEGKASCPDGFTCCNGSYGCCPIQNAVCCGDSVHCCPDGHTCDVIKGICKMGRKSVPLLKKIPAKPNKNEIVSALKTKISAASKQPPNICPDLEHECEIDQTCCMGTGGVYRCCNIPYAVCCYDRLHCCPRGKVCLYIHGTMTCRIRSAESTN